MLDLRLYDFFASVTLQNFFFFFAHCLLTQILSSSNFPGSWECGDTFSSSWVYVLLHMETLNEIICFQLEADAGPHL